MIPYKDLFIELGKRKIRYLVAGGFAVNFHQVQRATVDLDLIVHLVDSNLLLFVEMMKELGYRPRLPVAAELFADFATRESWIRDKGMMVFSYMNPKNAYETIDVFVREPKPFDHLDKKKMVVSAFGTQINVIGVDDLIEMKKLAGRDKDLFDISQLNKKLDDEKE